MASIYSWESFIRIHGGDPGARDVFEKVIDDLLRAENPDKEVHIVKASRGDGGIDVYLHQEDGIDIYQCKFFMDTLNSSRWSQIKESFKKAMEPKGLKVLRWYLCMPREMQKEDIEKWDILKEKEEKEYSDVKLFCMDGNEIISRMEECDRVNNTALIDKYFYENRKKHFTNKELIIPFTMSKANGTQGGTYVPREDLLSKIEESFKTERIVFLSGMGGCGKSELARAYGYKHRDDYEEIFWLTCDDGSAPDFILLMEKADLLSKIDKSDAKEFSDKVLIIVDNCNNDEPSFLDDLESWTGKARILITTRLSFIGSYESIVYVESDNPETFAYNVFEKNYCRRPRWGKAKVIQEREVESVCEICRTVQYNTMVVSLIGIRLREYSNLSISDCERKIKSGIGSIEGEIKYAKDQKNRSEEMADILRFLFADILNYPFSDEQKAVLTVLSLTSATWYEMDYVCSFLGKMSNEYAVRSLLDFGWLQGDGDRITIHPLIAEVISEQTIVITESAFFESLLENYLGLPDKYLRKESFLINKLLMHADEAVTEARMAAMLLLNHGEYKHLFAEIHPEVEAAYYVYVNHNGYRYFMYRDLGVNETYSLVDVPCPEEVGKEAVLLKVYSTGVPYTLDLNVPFKKKWINIIHEGLCWNDTSIRGCIFPMTVKSIEKRAFRGCKGLTGELRLPDGLTSIGKRAFWGCSGFSGELHLPDDLTSIGEGAFNGCSGFCGELRLPDGLMSIGNYAFSGCSGFNGGLHLPDSLASIGDYAFEDCCGFSGDLRLPDSLTSIGSNVFRGCSSFSGELRLPDSLTSIGNYAFKGCKHFSGELHLPDGLTSIGSSAFRGCSGFSGMLRLPDSLTNIGNRTFWGCSGFNGVYIPHNLTSIGNSVFRGCSGFNGELHLPDNLKHIGDRAFSGCSGFSGELHLPEGFMSVGNRAFWGCNGFSGKLRLPDSLTSIGDRAFSGFNGELRLPDSLTSIGDRAFWNCSGFNGELDLPDSLTTIGDYAFCGCSGFSGELHLPDSLTSIGNSAFEDCNGLSGELRLPDSLTSIGNRAFTGCNRFSGELRLSSSLTNIGDFAFKGCSGFSGKLHLPEGLTRIGYHAFWGCRGLSGELRLPESLTSIGEGAFSGCSGLFLPDTIKRYCINEKGKNISVDGSFKMTDLFNYTRRAYVEVIGRHKKLRLPEGLTHINECAYENCRYIKGELCLPDSLMSIGDCAFRGCSGFSGELRLPSSLTSIGYRIFSGCSGFSGELRLPDSLKSIGNCAFENCSGFSGELHLPDSLMSIGYRSFSGCSGFSGELRLPDSLVSIGDYAFSGCYGFSGDLRLPDSLMGISDCAFNGCSGFSGELRLPDSLTSIGYRTFSGCSGFRGELRLPDSLVRIGDYAFSGCSGFNGDLRLPDSLVSIGNCTFENCSDFSGNLCLPDSLTSIGYRTFSDCSGFSGNLRLPDDLASIGDYAFSDCSGFSGDLRLPDSLKSIGNSAFENCSGFSGDLCLPNSLTNIGYRAFSGCSGFSGELRLPHSLTIIGYRAFYGCDIKRVTIHNPDTEIKPFLTPYSSTVIVGYRCSTAEVYAREYGLVFEEIEE